MVWLLAATSALAAAQGADALFARLEAAAADLPRTTFDPAAVVAEVGSEPEALFAWVRDRVGFVAYRGALKGAAGTLLDGGGNALDRALLLRALLAAAGHESALAHATLAPEVAARVAASVRAPAPVGSATADLAALGARAEAELGIDGTAVAAELERLAAEASGRRTELDARAVDAADALRALVGAGPDADAAADLRERLVADHWWVVLRAPDGTLLDLDPTLPDAEPGVRLVDAAAIVAPDAVGQLAALEGGCRDLSCGDRLHTVRVGAIAEVVEDGVLVEHVLLDHELLPAELLGVPLALMVASDGDEDLDPFATAAPAEALLASLLERGAWQPVLRVGADEVRGRAVTAAGVVQDSLSGGSGGGALGGFGGGFGGGLGFGGGGDEADGFTALWWTFEVRTPGVGVVIERRAVFDRLGAAARAGGVEVDAAPDEAVRQGRALALGGQSELGLWPAAPSDALLAARAVARLLAERDAWSTLYTQGTALPMPEVNERLVALGNLRTPLERLALERGRGAAPQTGLFVAAHHARVRPDLSTDQGYDLIASPGAGDAGFAARLDAGARNAVLEALLAGGGGAVADAFRGAPAGWVALHGASGDVALDLGSADLAARVAADLAAGFVVVVPVGPDAVGWWRVDPATGATVAVGDRGWGQAMAGYAEQTNVVLQLRTVVNQYASMGQCLGMAISQPLQGVTGVGEELAECIFNLVCGQVHTALSNIPTGDANWTTVIIQNTIDALWGGVPEARTGSFCGTLWSRIKGG
jgi:hypothetical protein